MRHLNVSPAHRAVHRIAALAVAALLAGTIGCAPSEQRADRRAGPARPEAAPAQVAVARAPGALSAEERQHAARLYTQHCQACHGERGDGRGPAAVQLFPKPRDLRAGRFRLVSTDNGVPTLADLEAVLVRGMPGSSMPPWKHLSQEELGLLAEQVMEFRRQGARDTELMLAEEAGDELSEDELRDAVARVTSPGKTLEVPPLAEPTAEVLELGKQTYLTKGCASCHGNEGKGDGQQKMVDSEGLPTRPRDLSAGIYKGNPDLESVYRRIRAGMPGSPMPESKLLTHEEVAAMTHFVLAMSDPATREKVVLKRHSLTAHRVPETPALPDDKAWDSIEATAIETTPLWWRDNAEPDLQVEAVHDGSSVALRLTWRDATYNDRAVRADEFEDMAAVQFYAGPGEPFLGMGADAASVDLWQWRAGTRQTGAEDQLSDDYPFDMDIYRELLKGQELPDFLTARAAGNPLAARVHDGASLVAQGFGSLTFRPSTSQVVEAQAAWKDDRWVVVFRRPLSVSSGDGLELAAGQRASVAFALWDGEARDRAGQKLISIWNDLKIE